MKSGQVDLNKTHDYKKKFSFGKKKKLGEALPNIYHL